MEKFLKHFDSYETILWDWNGTLLNDVEIGYKLVIEQIKKAGLPLRTKEELQKHFCFPIKNYYEKIGFNVAGEAFYKVSNDYMEAYRKKINSMALFEGTEDILSSLSHKQLFVLSAAEESSLKKLVASYGLSHHFTELCGLSDSHAGSKETRCKKLIEEFNLTPSKTLLVGDTGHDAEVAKSCGLDTLLIADGFNHYDDLKNLGVPVLRSRYELF